MIQDLLQPDPLRTFPFLRRPDHSLIPNLAHAERRVFCFWTGDNPLTDNRYRALDSMAQCIEAPIVLITPKNLDKWIVPEHPLPEGFRYLSNVHKADYLRAYFMFHHGGGYSDIKTALSSWTPAFDALNANPGALGLGYQEIGPGGVAVIPRDNEFGWHRHTIRRFNRELKASYTRLIGNGAYIFKPGNELMALLLKEQERRIAHLLPELKAHPGNVWGNNEGYPIQWTHILGEIFHPLCFYFSDVLLQNNIVKPSFANYR